MTARFESLCLASGIEALAGIKESDATAGSDPQHENGGRPAHRWGNPKGQVGFHGGKMAIDRPRLRDFDGKEMAPPSWEAAQTED